MCRCLAFYTELRVQKSIVLHFLNSAQSLLLRNYAGNQCHGAVVLTGGCCVVSQCSQRQS